MHPVLLLFLVLSPVLLWFVVIYLFSLIGLLTQSFFSLDQFSGTVVYELTLDTYRALFTPGNFDIILRTGLMAVLVTITAAVLGIPVGYYLSKKTSPRWRPLLYLAIVSPLWTSYLVRVYSWKLILAKEGIVSWFLGNIGLQPVLDFLLQAPQIGGPSLSISPIGVFIVFVYVWLPFMIIPIYAACERVPKSNLEASADLGSGPFRTFTSVTLPLILPGVLAGSIFTFSLTLGDFIVPQVLGNSAFYIGQAVLSFQGTSGNTPLAAAMTMGPIVIMAVYLIIARRLGAFKAL